MTRRAKTITFLTREQEHDLAIRWKRDGDEKALHQLVEAYAPLVSKLASRIRGVPREDVVQEGYVGLLKAASRFNPESGYRFGTFAKWWAWSAMTEYLVKYSTTITGSLSEGPKRAFFRGERMQVVSLDTPLRGQRDAAGQSPLTLADVIRAEEIDIDGALDLERLVEALMEAASSLPDRLLDVIKRRWLSGEGNTLADVGATMGISRQRVQQIEVDALDRLREAMGAGA